MITILKFPRGCAFEAKEYNQAAIFADSAIVYKNYFKFWPALINSLDPDLYFYFRLDPNPDPRKTF